MSLSVNGHMKNLFLNGSHRIKESQKEILEEWQKVLLYLRNTGHRSVHLAEDMIDFYTDILFNHTFKEMDPIIEFGDAHALTSFQGNQFISSLLENSALKVIQANQSDFQEHQHSIQYVFTLISEKMLIHPHHQHLEIDSFLKNLVQSQQLPIEWAAIIKQNDNSFSVEKWFNNFDEDLVLEDSKLKADTIYTLSEALLRLTPIAEQKKASVLPIPYKEGTLLVCTSENPTYILPFISYLLQVFQKGRESLKMTKQENMWKDFVIMFHEKIMRAKTFAEAVEQITSGFVKYLPFERCALFSYSVNDQMGFGLYGQHLDNKVIQNITEDINNLPIIQNYIHLLQHIGKDMSYIQPVYIKDAALSFPKHYVQKFQLNSLVIAPIFTTSTSKLLGAAILDQGPGKFFKAPKETFPALLKFGQSSGELLSRYLSDTNEQKKAGTKQFSPREIEVLKLMAEGASTFEAASLLNLSEYTVRDYVSAIMQKMDAKNRTEAVAKAIREGFI